MKFRELNISAVHSSLLPMTPIDIHAVTVSTSLAANNKSKFHQNEKNFSAEAFGKTVLNNAPTVKTQNFINKFLKLIYIK